VSSSTPDPLSQADWSTLFDLLPIGAYRSSPEGLQLRANPALVKLNGYASEAEQIAAVRDIAVEWYVDPGRRAAFRRQIETVGRVQGFESEVWRHRTRERIWITENAHVVRDASGRMLYYEGTVEEITDRKRTLQALEHSNAQLQLISEQMPGVMFLARLDHQNTPHFEFVSAGVRDLYGVEPEEVMRDGRTLQRMRHPDDAARVARNIEAMVSAKTHNSDELRIVHRDGTVRWVRAASTQIQQDDSGILRCGVIIDITAQHTALALRTERDRAEASRQATVGLLSRISHELRTPLNAVLGFSQLLEVDASLGERQRRFASQAVLAGRHLLSLVDDVLDLTLAEGGRFSLNLADVDPQGALQASHDLLAAEAQAAAVSVHWPPGAWPLVRADPNRLRQVLTNLLSNAIKYNRTGGSVHVTVARLPATVPGQADQVVITVADTGQGLSADQLSRLFQPFERLGAEQGRIPGTGLGLSLSRQLARAMKGDIEVSSQPGEGACFSLRLPAA
jgi:PAS domain S-box-containing protein